MRERAEERSMPPKPVVRMVVPCRNEREFIGALLESVLNADREGMLVEMDVCDGMSEDGTRGIIQRFASQHPWIRLVDNPERTTPQAINLGFRRGTFDVGILMGAHAEIAPDFFRNNLRALDAHPDAGCVGGVITNVYANDVSRAIGAAMSSPIGVGNAHFRTGLRSGPVDTVAFGAYRREVFDKVGWFDERLVRNQDDEFNYRVLRAGYRIWLVTDIRCSYHVRASFEKLFRQYRQYGFWKVYVNRLHGTITTWRQVVPALFVLFVLAGGMLCSFYPVLRSAYLGLLVMYVVLVFLAGVRAAPSWLDRFRIAWAIFILHAAYGLGYLEGVVRFILLRQEPRSSAARSTR